MFSTAQVIHYVDAAAAIQLFTQLFSFGPQLNPFGRGLHSMSAHPDSTNIRPLIAG